MSGPHLPVGVEVSALFTSVYTASKQVNNGVGFNLTKQDYSGVVTLKEGHTQPTLLLLPPSFFLLLLLLLLDSSDVKNLDVSSEIDRRGLRCPAWRQVVTVVQCGTIQHRVSSDGRHGAGSHECSD